MKNRLPVDPLTSYSTKRQETRWAVQDAAYHSVRRGSHLHRILESLNDTPQTCDELEMVLRIVHQSCSAAVHTLMKRGWIVPESTRQTRSGHDAIVWRVAQRPTPDPKMGGPEDMLFPA